MTTKRDITDMYANVPLFAQCTKKELAGIAAITSGATVEPGRVLCRQGAVGREAFVIVRGHADVTIGGQPAAALGPGDFFGEMALLDGGPRVGTVTAVTAMELLVLSRSEFRQLIEENPTVAMRMLAGIATRLRDAERPDRLTVGV